MAGSLVASLVNGCSKGSDKKCTDIDPNYCCARVELLEKGADTFSTFVFSSYTELGKWPKETGPLAAVWSCNDKAILNSAVSNGYVLAETVTFKNKVKAYCDNATAVGASLVALATIFSASTF